MLKALLRVLLLCIFTAGARAEQGIEIAVLLKGMTNPYWKTLHDGVTDYASEKGIEIYIQGVQSDQETEQQLNVCNTMLLKKPKALIFAAVTGVTLAPCLKQASASGVLLVDVDGGMTEQEAAKMGIKLQFSVASDNYQLGKKAADYLSGINGKVLLIEGLPGSIPGIQRAKGFKENLPKGLTLVASLPGNWDRLRAADITNDVVTKHPDLAAIFAANDLMALGAAEALFSRKIENVKVLGVDGI
ncbi:MAG: LacI family transcriptional regulator, partial [Proteobacteria bacterium]